MNRMNNRGGIRLDTAARFREQKSEVELDPKKVSESVPKEKSGAVVPGSSQLFHVFIYHLVLFLSPLAQSLVSTVDFSNFNRTIRKIFFFRPGYFFWN